MIDFSDIFEVNPLTLCNVAASRSNWSHTRLQTTYRRGFLSEHHCGACAPRGGVCQRIASASTLPSGRRPQLALSRLKLSTSNTAFESLFDQASVLDMNALRLLMADAAGTNFIPARGVPWFMTLFGRDSLIPALQNILVHPDLTRSTLERLAELQATERDGVPRCGTRNIPHEIRHWEFACFI